MSQKLTTSLIATALQKLEAIRHNETEVVSDDECHARAGEIAKAALEAIAVCTKFVLSTEGEAEIEGLGYFYLAKSEIRFTPESDVLAFAVAKKQDSEKQQYALRNAFVKCISNALEIIPQLEFASAGSQKSQEDVDSVETPEERLLNAIFGGKRPNRFGPTVSQLLASMAQQLHHAGVILDPDVVHAFSLTAEEAEQAPERFAIINRPVEDAYAEAERALELLREPLRREQESSSNE